MQGGVSPSEMLLVAFPVDIWLTGKGKCDIFCNIAQRDDSHNQWHLPFM